MVYLLDTCVIIDLIRGDESTVDIMKSTAPNQVAISSITEFELRYGLEKAANLKNRSRIIVEEILAEINTLNFTSNEAIVAAKVRNRLRQKGTPIGPYDVLISATALVNNLVLVTSNEKEFNRIEELEIQNWRK